MHQDSLGSTSVVTNSSGAQYGYTRYYPYGLTRDSSGSLDTDKKFTGQRLDTTGLYYYGARCYDPTIGRFISPDAIVSSAPLPNGERIPALTVSYHIEEYSPYTSGYTPRMMDPQELNRYSYALNNPLRYTDPQGNQVDFAQALIQTGIPYLIIIGTGLLMTYELSQSYNQQQTGFSIGSVVTGVVNTGVEVVNTAVDLTKTVVDKIGNYLFAKQDKSREAYDQHKQALDKAKQELKDLQNELKNSKSPKDRKEIKQQIDAKEKWIEGHQKEMNEQKWQKGPPQP